MMDDLGQNYLDTGHYPEAIALYKDLMARDQEQRQVLRLPGAHHRGDDGDEVRQQGHHHDELDNQSKVYNEFKNGSHQADAKQECANKTAALLVETAMAWHLEAVGPPGQRGTGDPRTMGSRRTSTRRSSRHGTRRSSRSSSSRASSRRTGRRSTRSSTTMADLLYFQQRWAECGPAFDAVVAENPQAPEAAEAAYASVLCYQNIYERDARERRGAEGIGQSPGPGRQGEGDEVRRRGELAPKDFTDNQKGMISAFNRYICYIHPGAGDQQGQDQLTSR